MAVAEGVYMHKAANPYTQLNLDRESLQDERETRTDRSDSFMRAEMPAEETIDLHETAPEPNPERNDKPSMQTMVEGAVKLVSMLNFMKVELGAPKSLRSLEQWRSAAAEFVATLLFVFLGCGSVVATGILSPTLSPGRLLAIAMAHGLSIVFLAGAVGAISGGHINPAVTVAFVVAGKETLLRASLYILAQMSGAVCGASLLQGVTPVTWQGSLGSHNVSEGVHGAQAFLMEVILTFVLVFVIFGVAVDRRGPGVIAPLPIGFAVVVDHLVGVPFTGASMNPARSFGPAFVSGQWGRFHWIYWVAPCLGSALAAALYRYVFLQAPVVILPETAPLRKTNSVTPTKTR